MSNHKSKLLAACKNWDIVLASTALVILIIVTSLGVLMRYIFGKPFTWLEEIQLFCMVWIVFGASGAAFRTKSHVAIEMVVDSLPKKAQKVIGFIIDAVVVLVLGYLFIQSIGFVSLFVRSGRSTNMLKIPYWFIYGIAPVTIIIMIGNYFFSKYIKSKDDEEAETI